MRDEYDFSKAVRGKCYQADAELQLPIYLDQPVRSRLSELAQAKGIDLSTLVNALLKKDIELLDLA